MNVKRVIRINILSFSASTAGRKGVRYGEGEGEYVPSYAKL